MSAIFNKELIVNSAKPQDAGKLREIGSHQLLKADDAQDRQIASFDQVRQVGQWFLSQEFNSVLPSSLPIPAELLRTHQRRSGGAFLGKLAFRTDSESHYPVTIEPVFSPTGMDLKLHIVPVHFGALELAQFGTHTDTLLALAAAAAVAPQFMLSLEFGIATSNCSSKKDQVTTVTPDHATPLAVIFDSFEAGRHTLDQTVSVTGQRNISIKQAAHLHGQSPSGTDHITRAASSSKIASGVPIRTVLRSELPQHALFISTQVDESGQPRIVSLQDSLAPTGVSFTDLPFLAAALGFTARVVGESHREQTIEKVLKPDFADTPLREMINV